jgi:hypothetical protein
VTLRQSSRTDKLPSRLTPHFECSCTLCMAAGKHSKAGTGFNTTSPVQERRRSRCSPGAQHIWQHTLYWCQETGPKVERSAASFDRLRTPTNGTRAPSYSLGRQVFLAHNLFGVFLQVAATYLLISCASDSPLGSPGSTLAAQFAGRSWCMISQSIRSQSLARGAHCPASADCIIVLSCAHTSCLLWLSAEQVNHPWPPK